MFLEEIKLWLEEKQAEQRAYENFLGKVSIKYSNYPDFNYNHVVVDIPIIYRGKNIGLHRVLFSFDGEIDDDFYFFD